MPLIKSRKHKELKAEELKWECDSSQFDFDTTTNVKPIEGIVGQERALKALKIGVEMRSPGYNVFITGLSGTGKYTTLKKVLETIRPEAPELLDYVYVNNFKDPDRPRLLTFPAGNAKKFKSDLKQAINFLKERIPNALEQEPFLSQKNKLNRKYGEKERKLFVTFESKLRKDNFTLGQIKTGEFVRPEIFAIVEKQPVLVQQLGELIQQKNWMKKRRRKFLRNMPIFRRNYMQFPKRFMGCNRIFRRKFKSWKGKPFGELFPP